MKRVMVTGAGGMTGSEVSERARSAGWEVRPLSRKEADITDAAAIDAAVRRLRPDVVINCAAYTAVDRAESESELAIAVNGGGARNVARTAAATGVPVIHISTDYIFDGDARAPYPPDAGAHPMSVYGRTKLEGELAVREEAPIHTIVRTSWVFSHRGHNFVRSMLRLGSERDELRVIDDQIGRPTSAADLADALLIVADTLLASGAAAGTYHFANAGETSWFHFAEAIFDEARRQGDIRSPRLVPIPTTEYPTAARRPAWSVLDTTSFTERFGVVPRPWRDALRDTIARSMHDTMASRE